MLKKKLVSAAAVSALVLAGLMGTATAANAATAPTCVEVIAKGKSWGFPYVKIKNNCKTTQRVKVLWAWAPDSSCHTLAPGQTLRHSTGAAGRFDGLKKC